jgi:hypothetical protein
MVGLSGVLVCALCASACSAAAAGRYVSRAVPNSHVLLLPALWGGTAGWCLATGYQTRTEGGSGCGGLTRTSAGPIFAEGGCEESETWIHIYALTTSEVAAVSVAGGKPIATTSNSTLPDGLRAAAVEVLRHNGRPSIQHCPRLTPLDAHGKPMGRSGKPGRPQEFSLPGTQEWEAPARPPNGACEITATQLPAETVAYQGAVATQIRPYRELLGRALLSCADTVYINDEEHHLTSAVLLSASHPGATPPPLPNMTPLAGHPGIFVAPGPEGERAARRTPDAWLVVEEEDEIGLKVPVELLDSLHATIRLGIATPGRG